VIWNIDLLLIDLLIELLTLPGIAQALAQRPKQ
jgi:hypothetical protein